MSISFYPTPPDVTGRIIIMKGVTLAGLAQSEMDMKAALKEANRSKHFIRSDTQEVLCTTDFPQVTYNLHYVKTMLGSPMSKLHRTDEAVDLMPETSIVRDQGSKRLNMYDQIEDKLNTALIYMDKRYYPVATTLLQDALKLISARYRLYIPVVEKAYGSLLESPYGKSTEVAELGLQLLFVQMPSMYKLQA